MNSDPREHLARIARLVFARRLTDASGGNLSLREGQSIFMSPAHAGSKQQWQIGPADVVELDLDGNHLSGPDRRSREWQIHTRVYRAFERAGGIIHAQAGHFMAFVAAEQPLPAVLEHTEKFGEIGFARFAKAHSAELAANVVEALAPQHQALEKRALAVMIPRHGIVVVGRDLDDAFDALDRIETNAQTLLLWKLLS
jgi:L-fuculose-phosphate aldolase